MRISALVREVTPGISNVDCSILDEVITSDIGNVRIRTEGNSQPLGCLGLGGVSAADVVVEMVGVSRGSGGELYRVSSIHTPVVDHYIIDSLPDIAVIPISGDI